jgi:hypothetical protein
MSRLMRAMILLDEVVEIFTLPQFASVWHQRLRFELFERFWIGGVFINGDDALQLLKGMEKKDSYGYTFNNGYGYYGFGDIALQAARASEEKRSKEAIGLYRQRAERLIAQRGRQNYQKACTCAPYMRSLVRPCLLDNLRLMHNMGETVVAIDNIP